MPGPASNDTAGGVRGDGGGGAGGAAARGRLRIPPAGLRPVAIGLMPDPASNDRAGAMGGIDYEAEYNNRARVPEHPGIIRGWVRDAAAYREAAGPRMTTLS